MLSWFVIVPVSSGLHTMDKILRRVQEAPALFLANVMTHLTGGSMDSGDEVAWWLLHNLQGLLFKHSS